MPLERELQYYKKIKPELLDKKDEGKFALIKGEELIGTFNRADDAYAEGVKRFGLEPFLLKQILREDRTEHLPALAIGVLNARL